MLNVLSGSITGATGIVSREACNWWSLHKPPAPCWTVPLAMENLNACLAGGCVMRRVLIAAIRLYQRFVSPLLGNHCRFEPSCSRYAVEALEVHGVIKGGLYTCWRLLRCQPFCKGGYDPVPQRPDREK
mgnify:CR=1 FL=1